MRQTKKITAPVCTYITQAEIICVKQEGQMQQCEKNKILSRLRCLVQEMKSQTEQISEFYRFISESQIPESEALSFIKQHEDQNMMVV